MQDRKEGASCQLETEKRPGISTRHRTVTLPVPVRNQTFSTQPGIEKKLVANANN